MKIAMISDIHGNNSAFQTVWKKIKNYPLIINAGDFTGYYPDINQVINQLKAKNIKNILGNHDRFIISGRLPANINPEIIKPFQDNLKEISPQNMKYLKNLKKSEILEIDGLKIGLYHGSPFNADEYIYPDSSLSRFNKLKFDVLILGHTHWPMIKKVGKMTIINPGSVGQSRDYDNRASYAILDTKTRKIEIKRLEYDVWQTIRKVDKLGFDAGLKAVLLRNSKRIRVLVTAISGGSLGDQIFETLKLAETHSNVKPILDYYIVTTNIEPAKSGLYETDVGYLVPRSDNKSYILRILAICRKEKIQVVIPGSEPELNVISQNREKFTKNNILVLINSREVIEICQDKLKTMDFLKKRGLLYPRFEILKNKTLPKSLRFPVVIKPVKGGGGSRNVFIVQDQEDLDYYSNYYNKQKMIPLVQEYVGDSSQEYTVGVLTDFEGKLIGSIALKREVKGDLSVRAIVKNYKPGQKSLVLSSGFSQGFVGDYSKIRKYCEKIALALDSRGPLNIQCRKTPKGIYTMEINPRFSGTSPMRALMGFNEPDVLIRKYLLGQTITKIKYKNGLVLRSLRLVDISLEQLAKINRQKFIKNRGEI